MDGWITDNGRVKFGDVVESERGLCQREPTTDFTVRWSCLLRVAVVTPLDKKASVCQKMSRTIR